MNEQADRKKQSVLDGIYEFICKYGIFIFAAAVVTINFSLIMDNVVWGDEAFSCNIIRGTDYYGIFQRVYYTENHPPLYYYVLRVFADVLGYKVWVYHLVSMLFFTGSVAVSLTLFRKRLGPIPAAFFILFTGLSASCCEYNQEIRMYEQVFFLIFLCVYFSFAITEDYQKKRYWIGYVLSGVLAAYTHYYGLVCTGILLFITSCVVFFRNKKKTWLYGVISIVSYLILFSPWLFVLYKQMTGISGGVWWMTEPDGIGKVIEFVAGNGYTKYIFIPVFIIMSVFFLLSESKVIVIENKIKVQKPDIKAIDNDGFSFLILFISAILTIAFSYFMCVIYQPILAARYMYVIIPFTITMLMIAISQYIKMFEQYKKGLFIGILFAIWCVMLVVGLLDFKYYRRVVKTQSVETEKTLELIGTPKKESVFVSQEVPHLAWTVLKFYYPENEVYNYYPTEVEDEVGHEIDDMWAFMGREFNNGERQNLLYRGYVIDYYNDMQIAKYRFYLYHLHK